MQPWNKQNLISFAVLAAAAIVVFFTGIMFFHYFKAGCPFWAIIPSAAAIVYGTISFVKKYYQKLDY